MLTLEVTSNLVLTTPVDIGWARANWVPNIGVPYIKDLADFNPESGDVNLVNAKRERGIASVVGGYTIEAGPVYVTNNVPYIMRLNEGWSDKAPAGFVQAAVETAVLEVASRN